MSFRRAQFTKAAIRRAIQAAKEEGWSRVELIDSPDGPKVVIERAARESEEQPVVVERLE